MVSHEVDMVGPCSVTTKRAGMGMMVSELNPKISFGSQSRGLIAARGR